MRKFIVGGYNIDSLPYVENSEHLLYGDANDDKDVNVSDVIIIRHFIDNRIGLNKTQQKLADVNQDNKIDYLDVDILRKYIVGGYGVNTLPYTD